MLKSLLLGIGCLLIDETLASGDVPILDQVSLGGDLGKTLVWLNLTNRVATMSSQDEDKMASLALRSSSEASTGSHCAKTSRQAQPWWNLDLGEKLPIIAVDVYGEAAGERLDRFAVAVDGTKCAGDVHQHAGGRQPVLCGLRGRNVNVSLDEVASLTICRVRVGILGEDLANSSSSTNAALVEVAKVSDSTAAVPTSAAEVTTVPVTSAGAADMAAPTPVTLTVASATAPATSVTAVEVTSIAAVTSPAATAAAAVPATSVGAAEATSVAAATSAAGGAGTAVAVTTASTAESTVAVDVTTAGPSASAAGVGATTIAALNTTGAAAQGTSPTSVPATDPSTTVSTTSIGSADVATTSTAAAPVTGINDTDASSNVSSENNNNTADNATVDVVKITREVSKDGANSSRSRFNRTRAAKANMTRTLRSRLRKTTTGEPQEPPTFPPIEPPSTTLAPGVAAVGVAVSTSLEAAANTVAVTVPAVTSAATVAATQGTAAPLVATAAATTVAVGQLTSASVDASAAVAVTTVAAPGSAAADSASPAAPEAAATAPATSAAAALLTSAAAVASESAAPTASVAPLPSSTAAAAPSSSTDAAAVATTAAATASSPAPVAVAASTAAAAEALTTLAAAELVSTVAAATTAAPTAPAASSAASAEAAASTVAPPAISAPPALAEVVSGGSSAVLLELGSKKVEMSSVLWQAGPHLAVDGDPNPQWSGRSCTHTSLEDQPWWQVDLGANVLVHEVLVTNRADCCADRLNPIHVLMDGRQCGTGRAAAGETVAVACGAYGQKLRIASPKKQNFLTLCEVAVRASTTHVEGTRVESAIARNSSINGIANATGTGRREAFRAAIANLSRNGTIRREHRLAKPHEQLPQPVLRRASGALTRGSGNSSTAHRLMQGCSNSQLEERFGLPRFEADSNASGKVVCCSTTGNSSATRKFNGWCMSGQDGGDLKNYRQALLLCKAQGMRLCASASEVDLSCGTGCGADGALVWTSQKEHSSTSTQESTSSSTVGAVTPLNHVAAPVRALAGTWPTSSTTTVATETTTLAPALAWSSVSSAPPTSAPATATETNNALTTASSSGEANASSSTAAPGLVSANNGTGDAADTTTAVAAGTETVVVEIEPDGTTSEAAAATTTEEAEPPPPGDDSADSAAASTTAHAIFSEAERAAGAAGADDETSVPGASDHDDNGTWAALTFVEISRHTHAATNEANGTEVREESTEEKALRQILQGGLAKAAKSAGNASSSTQQENLRAAADELWHSWASQMHGSDPQGPPSLHSTLLLAQALLDGGSGTEDLQSAPQDSWGASLLKLLGLSSVALAFLY
mmetsp:Transcript_8047/g.18000  ORF Transcript_8047/g.18000 Transcript_8047/m.18000 type:complete len:1331 (-) Transcript_8047:91-4083(-)|eukprot:CAMPEP_0178401004 /NCGR_PEP_ID=MMETSP0689_2-20121128/16078_1 /TAXON_ID=160604 /ORGANISM="Amphidinium massartii, Strain CS-259" /LENGTH=1330 /DNA_ID=CAMNT_0020021811 /DNA_START=104 /DNA_END=4096 /DNA_ORIENTATION=-